MTQGGEQFVNSSRTVREQLENTARNQFENSRRVGHGEEGEGNEFEFSSSSRSLEFGLGSKFIFFKAGGVEFSSSSSSVRTSFFARAGGRFQCEFQSSSESKDCLLRRRRDLEFS